MAQNLKLKVLTLITKLSDRDTYNIAAAELESIAKTLENTTQLATYLSCILSTDTTDKPLVRKQCLCLLTALSIHHANYLSASLPKILVYITRRLRDHDSSIRTQCVATVSSLASKITKLPFSTAFLKPLSEAVFTEQEMNAQIGSALCLAAAINAAPDPEAGRLGKALVVRMERLLKSEGYKAKSAGLVVIGSVIGVGGVRDYGGIGGLVKCLVGFLSSDDWAARKAAAEALERLAVVERDDVAEFKCWCLKIFESRKFDKVKAAREVMHQMIEAWKQVPDVSEDVSPPPRSLASSKEDASDGRYPLSSKNSCAAGFQTPQMRKKPALASRTTPPDDSAATFTRRRGSLKSTEKKTSSALFRKVDCKKPFDWKVDVAIPNNTTTLAEVVDNENAPERRSIKPETRRALFGKSSDDKMLKFSGCKSGSRVVPCHEESPVSTAVASNVTENHHSNHKECEDLSSIRNQLVQIERQQSSLLDLLQRFMGSSQNGMQSLETRVHGLELALDEISYDLAVSSGRMTNSNRTTCCLLPGADFLSSKFWRKTESRHSASRLSSGTTPPFSVMRHKDGKPDSLEMLNLESRRLLLQGGGGFIVNPLAEIHESRGLSEGAQH
ncbi:TORTIFOLIA1-like protein 3 [Ricinus communis]|uniref:Microtubule-associated protein TORTIFOLIA1, putative n=1 Tax=Ricinus communis TaxID=3988 RepID=B9R900_RICCO|nr:TORTIFOLIA1-like protein 3 [Ricinus communis]EEF52077.1 Microtubule-associated protein TORTIFOLIA1, putative [Ricinus communis]|eukprot:XP_002511475.1 TORTIFOLIA1-like protein 3 [Ricinus communis]